MTIAMDKACQPIKYFINNTSNYGFVYCGGWGWSDCGTTLNGVTFSQPVSKAAMITRGTFQEFEYRISTPLPRTRWQLRQPSQDLGSKGQASQSYVCDVVDVRCL